MGEDDEVASIRTCFVITPIGAPHTPQNDHANEVLDLIINPVLAELPGLNFGEAIRADKMGQGGVVTHQIIDLIWTADLVIADLSFGNPNVFYELALRHGVRKPFVQIALAGSPLPFDVAGLRTVMFDRTRWGDIAKTKAELAAQIAHVMSASEIITPLTHYFNTEAIKSQGGLGPALSGVIQAVDQLGSQMTTVMAQLSTVRLNQVPVNAADYSLANYTMHTSGALGPQGSQGAFIDESAESRVPFWFSLRPAAHKHAQTYANAKLGRDLLPEELEDALIGVRRSVKTGAIRREVLRTLTESQVDRVIAALPKEPKT